MNRALLAPCLASFALAAIAMAELSAGTPSVQVPAPRSITRPAAAAALRTIDTAHLGDTILARPLFSADRRPASPSANSAKSSALPRLSAIMIGNGVKRVVFDDDGKPLVARVGGRAGPYVIMAIAADRISVLGATGPQTLRPTPAPSDEGGGTQPASESGGATGLSLLQQLQRGQVPHYAVPPPPTIQSLIARMRERR